MAYSQHEWVNGEIITAEKLNNMEQGIADCDTREIAASASATVDNSAGEPSCEVAAAGSVSSIDFKFAFKGIKGEQGEKGADAPTIAACELNIAGTAVAGKLTLSDGSSVGITGTYAAGDGNGESAVEEEDGGDNDGGDNGAAGGAGDGETVEAEPDGGDGGSPGESLSEESPEEGETEPESGEEE